MPDVVEDALARVRASVRVTPQLVVLAKASVTRDCTGEAATQLGRFLEEVEARAPRSVLIHGSVDVDAQLAALAAYLSAQAAFAEAIWGLVGNGMLVPKSDRSFMPQLGVGYTTVVPGSGGQSGGWSFPQFEVPIPDRFALTSVGRDATFLTDSDLFLRNLRANLDPVIAEALTDAVRCFKADLYLPATVMLGRAVEGLWIQLASALADAGRGNRAADRLRADLDRGRMSFVALLADTTQLYADQTVFRDIAQASGVRLDDLRRIREWSEVVRGLRNYVHIEAATEVPITYEAVAALLLATGPTVRDLVSLVAFARA